MTEEELQIIRRSVDVAQAETRELRKLLNEARGFVPADHPLQSQIRAALGLASLQHQDRAA